MTKIKAVVFDMDGTLIDSVEFVCQAMEDVLSRKGIATTRQKLAEVTGKPVQAMYGLLAPDHDPAELEKLHFQHHALNKHLLAVYEHAHETLRTLQKRGIRCGIFTGFDERCLDHLRNFELTKYFDSIVHTGRYQKYKPDPEGLLLCLEELQVLPQDAVYIGDGITDITAGRAASVRSVIGITHGFTKREELQKLSADYLIDSLEELVPTIDAIEAQERGK